MKLLLAGFWVLAVALGAAYGAALLVPGSGDGAKAAAATASVQTQKTRAINVPIVAGGVLRGFVAAQFTLAADGDLVKTLGVSPEAYLLDEAFRALYAEGAVEPGHAERYDLRKLTAQLVAATNARLGAPVVRDVLIENFAYVDKDAGKGG